MGKYFLKEGEVFLVGREKLKSGLYAANGGNPIVLVYVDGREVSYTTDQGLNAIGLTRTVVQGFRPIQRKEMTAEMRTWLRTVSTSWSSGLTGLARRLSQS